jgi:DNA-binding response OmpR family regulator
MRILIAEPDPSFAMRMFAHLETGGHTVDRASDGPAALQLFITQSFDVLVLAMRLPKLDALAVCRRLRQELRDDIPVVVYEESPVLADTLAVFRAGADDVVRADVAPEELEARMQALVRRRAGRVSAAILRVGELTYDPATLELHLAGKHCTVTPLTRRLLERLMRDSPRVVTNQDLEREIWGEDVPEGNSIRSHIWTLRRAIGHPAGPVRLQTLRGAGYRLIARNRSETRDRRSEVIACTEPN